KDNKFTSNDIYLGQRTINSLKAGAKSTAKTSLKIPVKTAKGTYYLIAITDATKKIKESSETNNNKYTTKKTTIK
ncbi:MAG TPA: CARDB domain-containing protein, partial [Methanobacterium sp.]